MEVLPAPGLWERMMPCLGDRRKVLGLAFILAVALIWVAASFFVQGIEERGAHPAVLTFVANSLFAIYVPVYYLNLRLRRRRQAAAAAKEAQERRALVPMALPRSDDRGWEGEEAAAAGLAGSPRSAAGSPGQRPTSPVSPASPAGAGLAAEDSHNGKPASSLPPMPLRQLFRAALVVSAGGGCCFWCWPAASVAFPSAGLLLPSP